VEGKLKDKDYFKNALKKYDEDHHFGIFNSGRVDAIPIR